MNCRRAQSDIALWAGNDLDESSLFELRYHLQACPACRDYLEQMQALMRLMEECPLRDEVDETSKLAVECSLWPGLCSRLVSLPMPRADRFNGWIPAIAVAAVCLAMLLVASPPQLLSPQDAASVPIAPDENWTINHSPQAHDAHSPRVFPAVGLPPERPSRQEELLELQRQFRAIEREFWARELEQSPPILMQSSDRVPRLRELPDPLSDKRRRADSLLRNDYFNE